MPFVLIILGLALVIAAARGTHQKLGQLLKDDFTGEDNFLVWAIVLGTLGVIGYHQRTQTFSRAFMSLVLLAMVLSNGGVFRKLVEALSGLQAGGSEGAGPAGNTIAAQIGGSTPGGGSASGGEGATLPSAGSVWSLIGAAGNMPSNQVIANGMTDLAKAGLGKTGALEVAGKIGGVLGAPQKLLKSIPFIGGFF